MAFQQGLSGLYAASKALDVTSNNVSNSATVGFKTSQAHFADVFANSLSGAGAAQVGIGASVGAIQQQFSQGNITSTNNPLDISINGGGFYRMSDNGAVTYSRAGQFHLDKSGYMVDDQARKLTGYLADATGTVVKAAPQELLLSSANQDPIATGGSGTALAGVRASLNFDSRAVTPTIAFDKDTPSSYNFSTATSIYDSLGNVHTLTLFAVKKTTPESAAATAAALAASSAADYKTAAIKYQTLASAAQVAAQKAVDAAAASVPPGTPDPVLNAASVTAAAAAAAAAATALTAATKASTAAAAAVDVETGITKATAEDARDAAYLLVDVSVSPATGLAVTANTDAVAASDAAVLANTVPLTSANTTAALTASDTAVSSADAAVTSAGLFVIAANAANTTAATANKVSVWTIYTSVDGTSVNNSTFNSQPAETLSFDQTGTLIGAPVGGSPLSIDLNAVMAMQNPSQANIAQSPLAFNLDFDGSTQFGSSFGTNSMQQDGYTSGRLTGVAVSGEGVVRGNYSNGQSRDLGQVALANFTNPNGLMSLGGNQWVETSESGSALVGAPNTGTLGVLQSAAVEESNVDLTAELVNMITEQRNYQANAQSIKTQDQIMQTLVNLR